MTVFTHTHTHTHTHLVYMYMYESMPHTHTLTHLALRDGMHGPHIATAWQLKRSHNLWTHISLEDTEPSIFTMTRGSH